MTNSTFVWHVSDDKTTSDGHTPGEAGGVNKFPKATVIQQGKMWKVEVQMKKDSEMLSKLRHTMESAQAAAEDIVRNPAAAAKKVPKSTFPSTWTKISDDEYRLNHDADEVTLATVVRQGKMWRFTVTRPSGPDVSALRHSADSAKAVVDEDVVTHWADNKVATGTVTTSSNARDMLIQANKGRVESTKSVLDALEAINRCLDSRSDPDFAEFSTIRVCLIGLAETRMGGMGDVLHKRARALIDSPR